MTALIRKAEQFAIKAHAEQKYGGHPYSKHLEDAVKVLEDHGIDDEYILCAAWLHDTIEDTDVSFEDIFDNFGRVIARIVFAVSDEPGKDRVERHQKTYPKIMAGGRSAVSVKLADRIANCSHSKKYNHPMLRMYQREYDDFRKALHLPGELKSMWATLDVLMYEKLEDEK